MNATTTNLNETFNPLFAKMQERFCANGTIAERMAVEAGIMKKQSKKSGERRTQKVRKARATGFKSAIFNLKNVGVASMCVLCLSVLFFSGATLGGVKESFTASQMSPKFEDAKISAEEVPSLANATYLVADDTVTL